MGTVKGVGGIDLGPLTFTYNGSPALPVGAATYAVVGSFAGAANYEAATGTATILIKQVGLTITIVPSVREFGTPNPTFTAAYSGFVGGETPAVLAGTLGFSTTAVLTSPVGSYPVTPSGLSSPNYSITFTPGALKIVDTTPPVIASVTPSSGSLWPPNHKMVPITIAVSASDAASQSVCKVVSVTSSEPANGLGDGDTAPDWMITGSFTVDLRSERSGTGSGRIYTITVSCVDSFGNTAVATTIVGVPRNQ